MSDAKSRGRSTSGVASGPVVSAPAASQVVRRAARFMLSLREREVADALAGPRLDRAIGVIYLPQIERASHYFRASLPAQFDAVIHIDETRAVAPLERTAGWEAGEAPQTYPWAV